MGSVGILKAVGVPKGYRSYEFGDPPEVESLNPRLTLVEEQIGAQHP